MTETIQRSTDMSPVELTAEKLPATVAGTVFFASNEAIRQRHIREGQDVTISLPGTRVVQYSETFLQIDFDSTGRNYIHLTLKEKL